MSPGHVYVVSLYVSGFKHHHVIRKSVLHEVKSCVMTGECGAGYVRDVKGEEGGGVLEGGEVCFSCHGRS